MNRLLTTVVMGLVLTASSNVLAQRQAQWTQGPGELGLGYPVPQPQNTPLPFDGFRTYAGLRTRHQSLMDDSDRITGEIVGQTREGRDIWAYRLSGAGASTPEGLLKGSIFYAGGVHAREWQSPEVVTGLMERVAEGAGDDFLTDYVNDHMTIVIQPVTNIDGFLHTQANPNRVYLDIDNRFPQFWPRDGRMRRKNLSGNDGDFFTTGDVLTGVDLNRNNPPFFPGPPDTGNPDDLTWRGPSPQSEPEIQALVQATQLAPADRLRFYADMHSYTSVFFSVYTSNTRRNEIQERLFQALSNHHAALPGNQVYVDSPSDANVGIGTTSEYFAQSFQIPSATWEIEPGGDGGVQYGGFGNNGHDGFILPESEIRRVRENLAESMLVAAYHMAGPPSLMMAEIRDVDTQAVVWSAHWADA
ncbi:MAG: M14 family metallopeptidase [Pseudomonadota bacterium]